MKRSFLIMLKNYLEFVCEPAIPLFPWGSIPMMYCYYAYIIKVHFKRNHYTELSHDVLWMFITCCAISVTYH